MQGQNPTVQAFCENSNGTSPFCALIERPLPFTDRTTANLATAFRSKRQNVQVLKTNGIDLELNYSTPLLGGKFSWRNLIAYQPDLIQTALPGAAPLDSADAAVGGAGGMSKLRIAAFLKYEINNFSVDVLQRWNKGQKAWNADRTLIYNEPPLPISTTPI